MAGFYVDVGAGDPVLDSVTKLFYDRGWHGINIEPHAGSYARLEAERPRDVNLCAGLAVKPGRRPFFESASHPGSSTFSRRVATSFPFEDRELRTVEVEVTTLGAVCSRHAPGVIDFLKIDAEGLEREVILGGDWRRFRPRVLVVEATVPNTPEPDFAGWEPLVLGHGYLFALFDGLNRFYVREEDRGLLQALAAPANVLDGFVPYGHHRAVEELRREIDACTRALEEARAYVRNLEAEVARRLAEDARKAAYIEELTARCAALEAEDARKATWIDELTRRLAELEPEEPGEVQTQGAE
jgi:FkbM family methyltransferase